MGIPKGMTREHALKALAALDAGEPHDFGESTRYDLVHDGRTYPPKAVVGIAAKFVVGQPLHPSDFSGGEGAGQANAVLTALGFDIVEKTMAGSHPLTKQSAEANDMKNGFSNWAKWCNRSALRQLQSPGVYAIVLSDSDISGTAFSWRPEVIYVGMTNAKGGLKSRLQQFDNTIKGGDGHGGGHRVRFKHPDYGPLVSRLYVSVCPYECNVESNRPSDLRIMGDVAKHEYECFAVFAETFNRLPEFNDKKKSPKK
jgi:hypothetical protein